MSNPTLVKQFVAEAAIASSRIVKFGSTDDYVVQGAAAGDALLGIVEGIAPAAGERVDVVLAGIAEIKLGTGGITRGAGVTSDATGQGVAGASGNRAIGYALASGVAGDIVRVLISQHTV